VSLCAKQDKTLASIQRTDKLIDNLKRNVGQDYATKDRVNELLQSLQQNLTLQLLSGTRFKEYTDQTDERIKSIYEVAHEVKAAVVNHTKHITSNKSAIFERATKAQLHEVH